jgi:hypothetical protein
MKTWKVVLITIAFLAGIVFLRILIWYIIWKSSSKYKETFFNNISSLVEGSQTNSRTFSTNYSTSTLETSNINKQPNSLYYDDKPFSYLIQYFK